ncbi:MAG: phosphoribosylglycinamide formyltransferase [Pseudomonadota bacterium]
MLVSGNGTNLQAIIDAAETGRIDAEVSAVVSDQAGAPALERARRHKIASAVIERSRFESRDAFEEAIAAEFKGHGVELVCLAGFMRILGGRLLKEFPGSIINIHPALLPSFGGLDAQRQAFEYGAKLSGCTVHFVDEKIDHGPIIMQAAVEVREGDTVEALKERILKEEHRIYPQAIQLIAEKRVAIEGRRVKIKQGG